MSMLSRINRQATMILERVLLINEATPRIDTRVRTMLKIARRTEATAYDTNQMTRTIDGRVQWMYEQLMTRLPEIAGLLAALDPTRGFVEAGVSKGTMFIPAAASPTGEAVEVDLGTESVPLSGFPPPVVWKMGNGVDSWPQRPTEVMVDLKKLTEGISDINNRLRKVVERDLSKRAADSFTRAMTDDPTRVTRSEARGLHRHLTAVHDTVRSMLESVTHLAGTQVEALNFLARIEQHAADQPVFMRVTGDRLDLIEQQEAVNSERLVRILDALTQLAPKIDHLDEQMHEVIRRGDAFPVIRTDKPGPVEVGGHIWANREEFESAVEHVKGMDFNEVAVHTKVHPTPFGDAHVTTENPQPAQPALWLTTLADGCVRLGGDPDTVHAEAERLGIEPDEHGQYIAARGQYPTVGQIMDLQADEDEGRGQE